MTLLMFTLRLLMIIISRQENRLLVWCMTALLMLRVRPNLRRLNIVLLNRMAVRGPALVGTVTCSERWLLPVSCCWMALGPSVTSWWYALGHITKWLFLRGVEVVWTLVCE